ncbi:ABC transporter related protein (plasmid) [Haloterrigena turkmenica DSM 5511]|uniref:ABC-type D-xylose/L-arabinose transporter n=1 Tax=Haloterrigena turkmenica (strain ATCC 51198 / DSM 5511 / JCM 9101 / NCIMB 13204 / VKM B-1734 / 4k) TaxID=543526 RepID=D2S1R2_HALTV|nr:ABC transporter ATP-binding protein [Haloterrigena turkmenica]ADB63309.1 ABC transporter related protein [Haloterrigena turkmenica DSM 5511]
MARLEIDDVTKEYRSGESSVVAVQDISVEVPDGDFLVLVGPSGCGKSTTLRMIAGLEEITEGEIRLGGRTINDVSAQERDIAMVFQSYALYPHKTVRSNMSFGLEESTELSDSAIAETVEETAAMMGIEDLLDRKPGELSGGQQQRVALGRAIVRDPDVFLMDEPLSNLDAKLRAEMRTELQHLQEQLDVTTVYVTHDQTEAMTMGDRIAVLNEGELQQVGTPLECYHEPNNLFVASFIGEPSMNFFDGTLENDALVTDYFEYPLSQESRHDLESGRDLVLGIRPEDVRLGDTEHSDRQLEAEVLVVEPMGNENIIHLRFDGMAADDEFVVTTEGVPNVSAGDRVDVEFPESAIHLFDGASGDAIKNRDLSFTGTPNAVLP